MANRRAFDERLAEECARGARLPRTFAVVLLDLDDLKGINDTRGHAAGDRALTTLAEILRGQARGIDLVARIGGDEFALCFAATSVCLAVSFVFIAAGREPAPARASPTKGANRGYWRRLPGLVRADRNFARYLLATALITAAGMAASFYTVDAKRTLRLDDAAAGAYAVVLLAASTVGNVLWGYAGDRIGHKRVVEGGTLCTGLAALLALLARDPIVYALVFALVGLGTSGIQLAALTFIVDFAPEAQRPTYVGLANLAAAPFAFAAPLLGGVLADRAGYPAVFALSAALGLAGLLVVLLGVVDPRMRPAPR